MFWSRTCPLGDYAIRQRDVDPWTTEEIFTLFPLLERLEDRRGGQLSGGEQQLLAIARALVARPRIMLLDEPSEGLAPVIVNSLVDAIVDLRKTTGMTMLLAEQNVPFAMRLASHIYVLEQGRMVWNGTKDEFDASPEVKDKHLAI
ncbi:UNVERIFIED_CONTAM: hypothetical protein GTU68_028577 [Idotea baltica]|nr:hypothetical protein [Idotea baltica]